MVQLEWNKKNQVIIKVVGVGATAEKALKHDLIEGLEILYLDSLGLKDTRKAVAGTDLLFIVADADVFNSACELAQNVKQEALVFFVALPKFSCQEIPKGLCTCSDAFFVTSPDSNHSDILVELLQCVTKSLSDDAIIGVDFESMKKLFSDAGRAFFISGEGDSRAAGEAIDKLVADEYILAKSCNCLACFEADGSFEIVELLKVATAIFNALPKGSKLIWSFVPTSGYPENSIKFAIILSHQINIE